MGALNSTTNETKRLTSGWDWVADFDGVGFPDILATLWRRTRGELWIFPGLGECRCVMRLKHMC
jgi:hypothetical protein